VGRRFAKINLLSKGRAANYLLLVSFAKTSSQSQTSTGKKLDFFCAFAALCRFKTSKLSCSSKLKEDLRYSLNFNP